MGEENGAKTVVVGFAIIPILSTPSSMYVVSPWELTPKTEKPMELGLGIRVSEGKAMSNSVTVSTCAWTKDDE